MRLRPVARNGSVSNHLSMGSQTQPGVSEYKNQSKTLASGKKYESQDYELLKQIKVDQPFSNEANLPTASSSDNIIDLYYDKKHALISERVGPRRKKIIDKGATTSCWRQGNPLRDWTLEAKAERLENLRLKEIHKPQGSFEALDQYSNPYEIDPFLGTKTCFSPKEQSRSGLSLSKFNSQNSWQI